MQNMKPVYHKLALLVYLPFDFISYSRSSNNGNVMVVFSPDDKYLLVSAVDNEVRQYLLDGTIHTHFETPHRGSSHNYTRSYYMNGGDYIIGMLRF